MQESNDWLQQLSTLKHDSMQCGSWLKKIVRSLPDKLLSIGLPFPLCIGPPGQSSLLGVKVPNDKFAGGQGT